MRHSSAEVCSNGQLGLSLILRSGDSVEGWWWLRGVVEADAWSAHMAARACSGVNTQTLCKRLEYVTVKEMRGLGLWSDAQYHTWRAALTPGRGFTNSRGSCVALNLIEYWESILQGTNGE